MPAAKLIADCGATKGEWLLINGKKKTRIFTQGISPYFLNTLQIRELITRELLPGLKKMHVAEVYYYGTGCSNPANVSSVKKALKTCFPEADI